VRHEPEAVAEVVVGRPAIGPGDSQDASLSGDVADEDVTVAGKVPPRAADLAVRILAATVERWPNGDQREAVVGDVDGRDVEAGRRTRSPYWMVLISQ